MAAVGVGLETKFTMMLSLALGLAVGMLATPARRQLATPWPQLAPTVAAAWRLPPAGRPAPPCSPNYGEAGAIDRYGRRLGLPPATSGHNGYWYWARDGQPGRPVVTVGYRLDELSASATPPAGGHPGQPAGRRQPGAGPAGGRLPAT